MSHFVRFISVLLMVTLAGCGADTDYLTDLGSGSSAPTAEYSARENLYQSTPAFHNFDDSLSMAESSQGRQANGGRPEIPTADPTTSAERKIIYVAQVSLVVEDFSRIESEIPRIVKQFEGYLADTTVDRTQGAYRTGQWTVRIPVEQYDPFLAELETLGVPEHRSQNAQDVTEEFVDLEARIENKKQLEKRILQLVEDREGKIKDVIEVERELARVREEIERMQGRLRYLANRTALTTVTIKVREEKDYVPPQAPSFASSISSAWTGSLEALARFGRVAVISLVAFSPWLILVVPMLLLVRWGWKRFLGFLNRPAQAR